MTHLALALVAAIFLIGLLPVAKAEVIVGRVVGVHDGDTITVLARQQQIKVRLAEVDAPELRQPGGQAAKQALSAMVFGRVVTLDTSALDRYGRTIALVAVDGRDVNEAMVRNGQAWAYRAYLPPECRVGAGVVAVRPAGAECPILTAEAEARAAHRGIWGLQADQRVPPWEWRRVH